MRLVRIVLITLLAGLATVGSAAPAFAATADAATQPAAVVQAGPGEVVQAGPGDVAWVTGQSWSSPAYPVECATFQGQTYCRPENAEDTVEQECYMGVQYQGGRILVCTTYEGHAAELERMGGEPSKVEYGCSIGDLACLSFENAGRGMALGATSLMFVMATNMSFSTDSVLWTAAVGEWSFWQWAVLGVVFIAMVWAVTAAIVSRDREQLVGAIVRSFLVIPLVPLTLWLIGLLVNTIDDLTMYVVARGGPSELFKTLQEVTWAGGQANYFFAFLIHSVLLLGMVLAVFVFMFRNLALAVLIAFGPVAWMLFPVKATGTSWVVRYFSAMAALLLTGPLTIGFLALIINGLAGVKTIWDPAAWPLLLGLLLIVFAPFAVFSMFSFIGGVAADSIGSRMGSSAARTGQNAVRGLTRMPSRLGASPAGSRGPTSRPTTPSASSGSTGGSSRSPVGSGSTPGPKPPPPSGSSPSGPSPVKPSGPPPTPASATSVPQTRNAARSS